VHQDVDVWAARFAARAEAAFRLKSSRQGYIHAARGSLTLNGIRLDAGDGAAISQEEILEFKAIDDAEMLVFDLLEKHA
jgi:redox-sensitive bicupin YhaK (pirin superfamily)